MSFKELFASAKKTDAYWVEKAILQFTMDLYAEMEKQRKSKSDLAALLGTSPAYITKVFRGNANFTIESMIKLTRALDCHLDIKVTHNDHRKSWVHVPHFSQEASTPRVTAADTYIPKGSKYEEILAA